ncbi:MAG: hypothetical protein OEY28_07290, partial [Nitrospira sp.]|nr:hypothetical protein [Nitrospira sp.]
MKLRRQYAFTKVSGLCCLVWFAVSGGTLMAAESVDTGFENDHARLVRKTAKVQEWIDRGLELADVGEKAKAVAETLQHIHKTDRHIGELRERSDTEHSVTEQRELQRLMRSLKDDVRSLGSGSGIVATLVDQLKAKLPVITEQLRDLEVPPKANFSFLKQTAFEATSPNPKDACAVVTRLTEGKQGIAQQLTTLNKTIEALNGVETRLTYADNLVQQVLSLM